MTQDEADIVEMSFRFVAPCYIYAVILTDGRVVDTSTVMKTMKRHLLRLVKEALFE